MSNNTPQPQSARLDADFAQRHILQELIDSIPDPIFYKDRDGLYRGCNEAFAAFLDRRPADILGKSVFDLSPTDLAETYRRMDEQLLRDGGIQEYESHVMHADGTRHTVVFHKAVFRNPDGSPGGIVGIIHDITDRTRIENELRASELRFRLIHLQSPIGIELYDGEGNLVDINPACMRIFGISDRSEISGFRLFDDPNVTPAIKKRLRLGETVRYRSPFSFDPVHENNLYRTSKTGTIHIDVIITPLKAADPSEPWSSGYLVQVQDITELIMHEEELKYLSLHDQLTGLFNRAYFEMELDRLQKSRIKSVGMIVCDIDGLKTVNDTVGHQGGDALIRAAALIIRSSFREGDMVARIGGDEFVAIVPGCAPEVLVTTRLRIDRSLAAHNASGAGPAVSLSVGTACGVLAQSRVGDIFNEADANMYAEKASRKNAG